jgi:sugar phosphate isomerase/epimerase
LGFADIKGNGDFAQLADFSSEHEFKLVQLSLDNPRFFPEKFDSDKRKYVRELFKERGIGLCFHGPTDIPMMNRHEKIRLAGLDRLCDMLQMAIDMGGEYFVFHPGRLAFYSMSKQQVFFMEQRYPERITEIFADSLRRLLTFSSNKIKLCIENTHAVSGPILKTVSNLASENGLGLVWDMGHTEQLDEVRRNQLIGFFTNNLSHVKLAHLHDVVGDADHKALGAGRLDINTYLEIINTLGIDVILEIFPEKDLLQSLTYLASMEVSGKTNRS